MPLPVLPLEEGTVWVSELLHPFLVLQIPRLLVLAAWSLTGPSSYFVLAWIEHRV